MNRVVADHDFCMAVFQAADTGYLASRDRPPSTAHCATKACLEASHSSLRRHVPRSRGVRDIARHRHRAGQQLGWKLRGKPATHVLPMSPTAAPAETRPEIQTRHPALRRDSRHVAAFDRNIRSPTHRLSRGNETRC